MMNGEVPINSYRLVNFLPSQVAALPTSRKEKSPIEEVDHPTLQFFVKKPSMKNLPRK
jgi:hypothetical protein